MKELYNSKQLQTAQKILDFNMDEISALHYALVYLKPKFVWACQVYDQSRPDSKRFTPTNSYLKCLEWQRLEEAAEKALDNKPCSKCFLWGDYDTIDFDNADKFTSENKDVAKFIAGGLNASLNSWMGFGVKINVVKKPYESK